jgi:hypothetical protein
MIRTSLATAMMLSLIAAACGGGDEEPAGTPAQTTAAPPPAAVETTAAPAPAAPVPAPVRQTASQPQFDQPWNPVDTGTVNPGMSRMDVVAVWGPPATERSAGDYTYLYYRNGCEVTCGTFDVVFLQNDQVVDAIVRGRGHTYSGMSSSPPNRAAEATLPGGTSGSE